MLIRHHRSVPKHITCVSVEKAPCRVAYSGYTEEQPPYASLGYNMFMSITYPDYYETMKELTLKQSYTYAPWVELLGEFPELGRVVARLSNGEKLNKRDEEWVREVSEATGWDFKDVLDELKNIARDPSERSERYWRLYREYLDKAVEHYRRGDLKQAGEKLYGAVLALVKYYAATKGVAVLHWSRGRIEKFVTSSVESELKKPIRDLLDKAQPLHEHFYEGHLDAQTFTERWSETLELLKNVEQQIVSRTRTIQ